MKKMTMGKIEKTAYAILSAAKDLLKEVLRCLRRLRMTECFGFKMTRLGLFIAAFCCFVFINNALANNIAISNVAINGVSAVNKTAKVNFDISWDNSWRTTTNYDAAWVFVKFSKDAGLTWAHARLKTAGANPAGFSQGSGTGLDIVVPADLIGAFLQRSAGGVGSVSATGVKLVWDWNANGVAISDTVLVKVFAIEMVYIPTGAFYLGSGGSEISAFYTYPTTTNPYLVSSEGAINVGATNGYLYYAASNYGGDRSGPIPAAFPKGYAAFYMMKYEISQGQYAGFLNNVSSAQATARNPGATTYRYTISGAYPNFSASAPDRACNWLSSDDVYVYLDWAGLRPMSELEFEKACRGTIAPVANEYVWGASDTPTVTAVAAVNISGAEDGTETITSAHANSNFNNQTFIGGDAGQGPLRCGIFATAVSTRIASGASYYGVMDLADNVLEWVVSAGSATSRAMSSAVHGDGDRTTSIPDSWRSAVNGWRGSAWLYGSAMLGTSYRAYSVRANSSRGQFFGGRGVRTAP